MSEQANAGKTPFRVKAESIEACNCQHGCNCQFAGYPNEGLCEFIVGYEVKDGQFGDISLKGVRAVVAAKYPKAIHEGHGHVVLFVDDKASPEQVNALTTILSGKMGGMPWEALAGTIEHFDGPIRKPVEITISGERSSSASPGCRGIAIDPAARRRVRERQRSTHRLPQRRFLLERRQNGYHGDDARRTWKLPHGMAEPVCRRGRSELDQPGIALCPARVSLPPLPSNA